MPDGAAGGVVSEEVKMFTRLLGAEWFCALSNATTVCVYATPGFSGWSVNDKVVGPTVPTGKFAPVPMRR